MKHQFTNGSVAFITGGSSGIGAALAMEFARRGADVVITSRRAERLHRVAEQIETQGVRSLAVPADVTRDGELEAAAQKTLETFGRIDWVVANAGFGVSGPMAELSLEDYRRQFETNIFGVLRTVYATRPALEQSKGALAVIGSGAGEIAFPEASPYAMSKAAAHRLAECLWFELDAAGVGVTSVMPGYVESEIRQVDRDGVLHADQPDPVPQRLQMPAATAARKIVDAMVRRRRQVVLTRHGKALLAVHRHLPWLIPGVIRRSMRRGIRKQQRA